MKILVAGLGSIGQRHVRNLRALRGDSIELSAWRVRKEPRVLGDGMEVVAGEGLEATYGIRAYDELDEALAAKPDAVLVCNPTRLHLPVALAAARAGAHLFLEKPVSDSLDGVDELLRLVDARGLVSLVAFQMRFHPCFAAARKALGAIGTPVAARFLIGEWLPGFHPWEDYRQGYAARRELGGGVVLTLIHELDAAYALFGRPRRVFALGGHRSRLELDVEDVSSALLDCEVRGVPVAVHVQQDYLQKPGRRQWEFVGDAGRVEIDLAVPAVATVDAKGERTVESFTGYARNEAFLAEMRHFLACVEGRETSAVPLREGLESQRIAAAIHRSMSTGEAVRLP